MVRLNWRIIQAPMRLVDYVVVHEVAHLVHRDHSKAYWRLVARVMPDYEQRRAELAAFGPAAEW
jgi:predicted metal-dependent hydrolase